MFVLVIGKSKTGKSKYAEQLAAGCKSGALLYIATMIPVGEGEEGAACVNRHRAQREGLGFETIEHPMHISGLEIGKNDTILLEDVSNLLANNLFCEGGTPHLESVAADLRGLCAKCENLIAVSFYGLEQSDAYDAPTNHYIAQLAALNELLIKKADCVVEMQAGKAVARKGNLP